MTPQEQAEEEAFRRLYGPWEPLLPDQVAGFLAEFDAPWWLVGGWSIEAFTGLARPHEDIDVVVFRRDLPRLRTALAPLHLWSAGAGALRPLNDDWPDVHPDAGQVWVREHALAPWLADVILQDDDGAGRWVNKRWAEHVADLQDVTWVADDGIRYLLPEVALLHKARLDRPKDRRDLGATWPLLSLAQQDWLVAGVVATEPADHPWQVLASGSLPPAPG
ncbi:MAG: hypothetical protein F2667_13495 [Actinobacteria bacterium]|uniref:Unannotated protein n=1 Tax=freshwater metagenome TaxID=449393 RepID=A0A6J6S7X4_9ZZZZ|nr:hypothetical protein [Actinomycetota bacterium]